MSYKKALIRLLDRPGGRLLLAAIATRFARRLTGDDLQIAYLHGLWTHRAGPDFFPDSPSFAYTYRDLDTWKCRMTQYVSDTNDFWLRHYVPKEGDTIIDVGAGRGEDTVTFSRGVGKTGRVIAIEAHPLSFAILKNFCRLNRLANVTPLQLALMDKSGTVRIVESESSWMENTVKYCEGASGIQVRAGTLDEVCQQQGLKNIAFLKMNIEGAEREALLGADAVMPCIRQICVACHDFRSNTDNGEHFRTRAFVERFLVDHGFTVTSRLDDPRDYVRDHVYGLRPRS